KIIDMKKKLILAMCLLVAGIGYVTAQDILVQDVPSVVKSSFDKAFTKASKVEWEMKGNLYNAEFEIGRRDYEVWLDQKGSFVKVKKEMRANELPAVVLNSVKQNYKGYRIADVDRFEE